jgi:hypothetical protein
MFDWFSVDFFTTARTPTAIKAAVIAPGFTATSLRADLRFPKPQCNGLANE